MRNKCLKLSSFIAMSLLVIGIGFAISQENNEIFVHDATVTSDARWVLPNTAFNVTFQVFNHLSSGDNITYVSLDNVNSTHDDPYNITYVSCPSSWSSYFSDSESTKDGYNDKAECDTHYLKPGEHMSINLSLISKNIPAGTALDTYWSWLTQDEDSPSIKKTGFLMLGIDAKQPVLTINTPADKSLQNGNVTFNVTAVENEVQVNKSSLIFETNCSGTLIAYTSPVVTCTDATNQTCTFVFDWDSTMNTTDGLCNVTVNITDTLGNIASKTIELTIDNTAPTIVLEAPANDTYINSGTLINLTVTDDNFNAAWWFNGTKNITLSAPFDIDTTNWTEGSYLIPVYANDTTGNSNSILINIGIDNTPPALTFVAPTVAYRGKTTTVQVNVNDALAGLYNGKPCPVKIDGIPVENIFFNSATNQCIGSVTVSSSQLIGTATFLVQVTDDAGNLANVTGAVDIKTYSGSSGGGGGGYYVPPEEPELNSEPDTTAPMVDNEQPYLNAVLTCVSGEYSDSDNDLKQSDSWRWYKNGIQQYAYSQTINLTDIDAKPSDVIKCAQQVSDGKDYSGWVKSSNEAVVQQEPENEPAIPGGPGGGQSPMSGISGITGAFIGSLDELGPVEAAIIASIVAGLLTFLAIRFFKRNKGFDIDL